MRDLGIISDAPAAIPFERWLECAARHPRLRRGRVGTVTPDGYRVDPSRWMIVNPGVCVSWLEWERDYKLPGEVGYLVVSAAQPDSPAMSQVAESVASDLGATFQRCSARFSEIEDMVERPGDRVMEIHFEDGRTRLVAPVYCALTNREERLYYHVLDPNMLAWGEGLCFTRIDDIRSIRWAEDRLSG
jgi:hypothetical protein